MREEKKLDRQKVLNAEKALSDAELDAVTGGFSRRYDPNYRDQISFGGYKCRSCGATVWEQPDDGICPQCGQRAGFTRLECL